MEYQVPQFIEVEDKVVGPLTLRQFIFLGGAAGLCVAFFLMLPILFALLFGVPVAALGVALAFYKVNGKPFIEILEAGFSYYTKAKLFLWRRAAPKAETAPSAAAVAAAEAAQAAADKKASPRLSRGKLSELAWSLDVQKSEQNPPTL